MSKSSNKQTPKQATQADLNHKADQANAHRGTKGTNRAYDHVQGNRGAQLNPNRRG